MKYTVETIHANGNFSNVNEVHNNTGTMTLSGFNQEGGKVTGNIGKVEVISRQNTSTTTGSSKGVNLGISANGVPSSVTINASRTNGNRAFVDNQSTFVVGEGSNLHVGTVENTGAVIGKEGNSSLKINEYTGKDIHNHDTMKTVGITAGTDGAGVNYENSVKEGITRNTVIGSPEIGRAEGAPINTDISKANETTREEHRKTNVFLEPQTIDYAMNPGKFREDFEVAVLEGKATGEAILKTIENLVNGRKSSDMADPERRTLNEIKESIIRVKTAPQMESIAEAKDLNSPDVLKQLDIAAIEKFNPDNPDLPENVRARLDELAEDGKTIKAFYDKTTNKIFVNENLTDDSEIRAGIAREWKISEDLKDGKGKPNEEGRVKATVAGELAYDDMMKRGCEGKTESISTDSFADAVMDEDSEVTADSFHLNKADNRAGNAVNKPSERRTPFRRTRKKKYQEAMKENNGFTIWNEPRRKGIETLGYFSIGNGSQKLTDESKEMIVREGFLHIFITGNLKYEKTPDKIYSEQPEVKKKIEELQKKAKEKSDKNTTYYVRVDSKNKTVTLESSPTTKNLLLYHALNDVVKGPVKGAGNLVEAERLTWTGHPIKGALKRLEGIGNISRKKTLL